MSPLFDHLLVAAAVTGAACYFLIPLLNRRKSRGKCGGGCCSVAAPLQKRDPAATE